MRTRGAAQAFLGAAAVFVGGADDQEDYAYRDQDQPRAYQRDSEVDGGDDGGYRADDHGGLLSGAGADDQGGYRAEQEQDLAQVAGVGGPGTMPDGGDESGQEGGAVGGPAAELGGGCGPR